MHNMNEIITCSLLTVYQPDSLILSIFFIPISVRCYLIFVQRFFCNHCTEYHAIHTINVEIQYVVFISIMEHIFLLGLDLFLYADFFTHVSVQSLNTV